MTALGLATWIRNACCRNSYLDSDICDGSYGIRQRLGMNTRFWGYMAGCTIHRNYTKYDVLSKTLRRFPLLQWLLLEEPQVPFTGSAKLPLLYISKKYMGDSMAIYSESWTVWKSVMIILCESSFVTNIYKVFLRFLTQPKTTIWSSILLQSSRNPRHSSTLPRQHDRSQYESVPLLKDLARRHESHCAGCLPFQLDLTDDFRLEPETRLSNMDGTPGRLPHAWWRCLHQVETGERVRYV